MYEDQVSRLTMSHGSDSASSAPARLCINNEEQNNKLRQTSTKSLQTDNVLVTASVHSKVLIFFSPPCLSINLYSSQGNLASYILFSLLIITQKIFFKYFLIIFLSLNVFYWPLYNIHLFFLQNFSLRIIAWRSWFGGGPSLFYGMWRRVFRIIINQKMLNANEIMYNRQGNEIEK